MTTLREALRTIRDVPHLLRDGAASGNARVLASLLGPAYRGLVERRGRARELGVMHAEYGVGFTWDYARTYPEMARLYEAAKSSQWNARTDIAWDRAVERDDPRTPLVPDGWMPQSKLPIWRALTPAQRSEQKHAVLAWLLSQFLHGEQGALFAAAQVTEGVPWLDAKLYGSSQVADEGRHVEVFHTYLTTKLEKLYTVDDNLYVVIDALMTDSRWDMKFLGMQIMIEGLALGAFGAIRRVTGEPLLKDVLRAVITDEARHVHFGVLALSRHYAAALSERERREREDWAFEVSLLLRNRFFMREVYDEYYAHSITREAWDSLVAESELLSTFRQTMFKRIIPNLKRIGLLSERIRPRYRQLGLLDYESGPAATELSAGDLLE